MSPRRSGVRHGVEGTHLPRRRAGVGRQCSGACSSSPSRTGFQLPAKATSCGLSSRRPEPSTTWPKATMERGASQSGRLVYAAVAHPSDRAAPRTYLARSAGDVLFYDGLPLPRAGAFASHDARVLLEQWGTPDRRARGGLQHRSAHFLAERVECLLDVLGMAKVFLARRGEGFVLSNSVDAAQLLTGESAPDPVGVSSMLGFGWAAGGRSLLDGVRLLEGGHLHDLTAGTKTRILTPESVAPRNNRSRLTAADVAESLTETARSGATVQPAHVRPHGGARHPGPARACARGGARRRLLHERARRGRRRGDRPRPGRDLRPAPPADHPVVPNDWAAATSAFSSQTDGLASFWIVADWVEHQGLDDPVGLKLWGPGGEIGRAGNIGLQLPFGATTPGLRSSVDVQRRNLHRKVVDFGGLVHGHESSATARGHLDNFIAGPARRGMAHRARCPRLTTASSACATGRRRGSGGRRWRVTCGARSSRATSSSTAGR